MKEKSLFILQCILSYQIIEFFYGTLMNLARFMNGQYNIPWLALSVLIIIFTGVLFMLIFYQEKLKAWTILILFYGITFGLFVFSNYGLGNWFQELEPFKLKEIYQNDSIIGNLFGLFKWLIIFYSICLLLYTNLNKNKKEVL